MTDAASTGRSLIYLICFGDTFRRYATMAIRSIREIGGWAEDIVLLTDSSAPLAGCEGVIVIDVLDAIKARYPWAKLKKRRIPNLKPEIEHHVDLSRYDYALYLDCDILINSNRLGDLVGALRREAAIVVQQDIIPVSSGLGFAGGKTLTPDERQRWGAYAINAGLFGFPTTPMGRRLLRDWRRFNIEHAFKLSDQGNLVALLLRKYYGQWGYVGDSAFPREHRRYDETFLHFTTHKDTLMESYYRDILGLTPPA